MRYNSMTIEALEAEVAKRSLLYRFPMNWNNEQRKERLIGILEDYDEAKKAERRQGKT
tara:strand:- start:39 stop:212 length:174 start_codon:yes stop_codon:yes gene_type:complete